jgi:hypothetical protein
MSLMYFVRLSLILISALHSHKTDSFTLSLTNEYINGSDDFINTRILPEVDQRLSVFDGRPKYLATRIDSKLGPIKLAVSAQKSRTTYELLDPLLFQRNGKGNQVIYICYQQVSYAIDEISEPSTPMNIRLKNKKRSQLGSRTTLQPANSSSNPTVKAEEQSDDNAIPSPIPKKKEKASYAIKTEPKQRLKPGPKPRVKKEPSYTAKSSKNSPVIRQSGREASYGSRKRGISQVDDHQLKKSPNSVDDDNDDDLLDLDLGSYDTQMPSTQGTPTPSSPIAQSDISENYPYQLRERKEKKIDQN